MKITNSDGHNELDALAVVLQALLCKEILAVVTTTSLMKSKLKEK